jgi:ribosomal protein S18 acetylase RimI-like enzyme
MSTIETGIVESRGLSKTQLLQIEQLADQCEQFENLTMKLNWNRLRNRPAEELNDFLFYSDSHLVGYLALYIFNTREVEISAMVAPSHRRQGIFSRLLQAARQEIIHRKIPDILFICEHKSPAVEPVMARLKAAYEFSEHKMIHTGGQPQPPKQHHPDVTLRPATIQDIQMVAQLDEACFNVPPETSISYLSAVLDNHATHQLSVIMLNTQPIGKIQTLPVGREVSVSAFCIWPEHRHKGIGYQILSRVVTDLLVAGWDQITLEVETKNRQALKIYQRAGFESSTTYDYYRLPLTKYE